MKKVPCFISGLIVLSVLFFLHHEQSLAIEKKYNVDTINSNISITYTSFQKHMLTIRMYLVEMQDFFESDPSLIPDIYNKYYQVLNTIANELMHLEKDGLELQELCNDLDNYSNKVCFVYGNNILEVKDNIKSVVKKFNDVILKYNDMSLSDYEIFR